MTMPIAIEVFSRQRHQPHRDHPALLGRWSYDIAEGRGGATGGAAVARSPDPRSCIDAQLACPTFTQKMLHLSKDDKDSTTPGKASSGKNGGKGKGKNSSSSSGKSSSAGGKKNGNSSSDREDRTVRAAARHGHRTWSLRRLNLTHGTTHEMFHALNLCCRCMMQGGWGKLRHSLPFDGDTMPRAKSGDKKKKGGNGGNNSKKIDGDNSPKANGEDGEEYGATSPRTPRDGATPPKVGA